MIKDSVDYQKTHIFRIVCGGIVGGVVGMLIGLAVKTNNLANPTFLGIIIGGFIGAVLTRNINNLEYVPNVSIARLDSNNNVTFKLKKEQLDLAKEWIQTGEVNIYKENFTEEKSFTVPVEYEELVIEKKDLTSATAEPEAGSTEVIRILLSKEQVQFTKKRVTLEDVSIYKQQIKDIRHIEETLKREELKVRIPGARKVREKSKS